VRILLLVFLAALAGCATIPQSRVTDDRLALGLNSGAAQTSSGHRVERRSLPLTRGQKIALWTGVAVLIAYVMAESADDDEDTSAFAAP
jgi:hypothetical protein